MICKICKNEVLKGRYYCQVCNCPVYSDNDTERFIKNPELYMDLSDLFAEDTEYNA